MRVKPSVILLVVLLAGLALSCTESSIIPTEAYTGYFAPIFSPDGRYVYYVIRDTRGRTHGPGVEFFTPPAEVRVDADLFTIHRFELKTGKDETVAALPDSPLASREIETYHSRIFTCPRVHLRFAEEGRLEYEIAISVPTQPTSTKWRNWRTWNEETGAFEGSGVWLPGDATMVGTRENSLLDDREVVTVPGPECYPAAIVILHHESRTYAVHLASAEFEEQYPDGLTEEVVYAQSMREPIERTRAMKRAYDEAVARFRADGLAEGEAMLRANKEMKRLGYFPETPTLRAKPIVGSTKADTPTFEISVTEFRVGLFQDIAAAIGSPGTDVDKSMGKYVRHRDYDTSEKINAFLETGGSVFIVSTEGRLWEIEIDWKR